MEERKRNMLRKKIDLLVTLTLLVLLILEQNNFDTFLNFENLWLFCLKNEESGILNKS